MSIYKMRLHNANGNRRDQKTFHDQRKFSQPSILICQLNKVYIKIGCPNQEKTECLEYLKKKNFTENVPKVNKVSATPTRTEYSVWPYLNKAK